MCFHCEHQLSKKGRHRRHKRCAQEIISGNVAGPCWCPACNPLTVKFVEYLRNLAPMSLSQ